MLRYFLICEYSGVRLNVHFLFLPVFFFILFDFRIWYDILKRFDETMRFFICLLSSYSLVELCELFVCGGVASTYGIWKRETGKLVSFLSDY